MSLIESLGEGCQEHQHSRSLYIHGSNGQGPVVRSLVSANCWLRGIKTYRFPWCLTLVSANHASSNPGQNASLYRHRGQTSEHARDLARGSGNEDSGNEIVDCIVRFGKDVRTATSCLPLSSRVHLVVS